MSSLNISDDALNQLVAKSIVDSLTPETRAELIAKAIAKVLEPQPDRYGAKKGPSQIQEAFNNALYNVAQRVASEQLENDPIIRAEIEKMFAEAAKAVFDDAGTRGKIVSAIGHAITTGLKTDRY